MSASSVPLLLGNLHGGATFLFEFCWRGTSESASALATRPLRLRYAAESLTRLSVMALQPYLAGFHKPPHQLWSELPLVCEAL